jgi:hypothetical protein
VAKQSKKTKHRKKQLNRCILGYTKKPGFCRVFLLELSPVLRVNPPEGELMLHQQLFQFSMRGRYQAAVPGVVLRSVQRGEQKQRVSKI